MQYCGQDKLVDYFNFSSSPEAPLKVVACGLTQGEAGIPPTVLSLFVFGAVGIGLTYRVRHPAPILVAFMLTGGVAVIDAPGQGVNILAAVVFFGLAGMLFYLYQKASRSL